TVPVAGSSRIGRKSGNREGGGNEKLRHGKPPSERKFWGASSGAQVLAREFWCRKAPSDTARTLPRSRSPVARTRSRKRKLGYHRAAHGLDEPTSRTHLPARLAISCNRKTPSRSCGRGGRRRPSPSEAGRAGISGR